MPTLPCLRADPEDPFWADRDRVLTAPDAPAPDPHANPQRPGAALANTLATSLSGPPGVAFGAALGLAIGERLMAARFGRSLVDHRTWLLAGPAELAAGPSHEAAAVAGALTLRRLTVVAALDAAEGPALARFSAMGWAVRRVEAGDSEGMASAISAALRAQKPTLIAALHGAAWVGHAPELAASPYGAGARRAWLKRLRRHAAAAAFQAALANPPLRLPPGENTAPTALAAVQEALVRLGPLAPDLAIVSPETDAVWAGRHHAAAAAMLGLAQHGGILPAGWFAPVAWSALLPAQEAAAQLRLRMLTLFNGVVDHDSPALVFRPAGGEEAMECLALALRWQGPTAIELPEGEPAALPPPPPGAAAKGGYRAGASPQGGPSEAAVTLIASGADIHIAQLVHAALAATGIAAALVSLPCRRLFEAQEAQYRSAVLGDAPRICLASGALRGWAGLLGPDAWYYGIGATTVPGQLAARIERRLSRGANIVEPTDMLLESAPDFD